MSLKTQTLLKHYGEIRTRFFSISKIITMLVLWMLFQLSSLRFFFISQLNLEQITALYDFGRFQYTHGNYSGAADYPYYFCVLSTDNDQLTGENSPHRKMGSSTRRAQHAPRCD